MSIVSWKLENVGVISVYPRIIRTWERVFFLQIDTDREIMRLMGCQLL